LLAVIVGLAVCQIGLFCTTIYLHRAVAHRSIVLSAPLRFTFRFLLWITTGIKPREWAAVHRKHHAFTDVEGDPHSPLLLGFWRVQLTNAALYRRVARDGKSVDEYASDLKPDRLDKLVFDHAFVGLGVGITILCVSLGWPYGLLAAGVHTVTYLGGNGAINAFGHVYGWKNYDNTATNLQWLAIIVAGEGLHNNHHAMPMSPRLSLRKGEIDPGWIVIRGLQALHLCTPRLDPSQVPYKPLSAAVR
jgi:stearoyl-CoA desaturase (delta-9 desaturase)